MRIGRKWRFKLREVRDRTDLPRRGRGNIEIIFIE